MTLADWDKDIKATETTLLIERLNAIRSLSKWATFHKEFGWTSYKTLAISIWYALHDRQVEGYKGAFDMRALDTFADEK